MHGSTGKPVRHHRTYELVIPSGDILHTRVSKPVDRTTYSSSLWSAILRDQLKVTAKEFWDCVYDKVLPDRGGAAREPNPKALPLHILSELIDQLGLTPEAAIRLTLEEAVGQIAQFWADEAATGVREIADDVTIFPLDSSTSGADPAH